MAKSAEFILDYEHKQVLVLEPFGPYYESVVQRLGEQPDLQVVECKSLKELSGLGRQVGVNLILAHCESEAEMPEFVAFLEFLRPEIKRRHVRVVITVNKNFVILHPKFVREGASEVIEQPISPKSLYAKLDRYLCILPSRDAQGNIIPPRPRRKGAGADLSDEPTITWKQPLTLKSDVWTTVEGRTRWVPTAHKWAITLIGPPPICGDWTPSKKMEGDDPEPQDPTWQWTPKKDVEDPFTKENGAWKFRGEKPEYTSGAWQFQGKNPKLAFVEETVVHGTKVEGDQECLTITEDSEQAKEAINVIEKLVATFEPDYLQRSFYDRDKDGELRKHLSLGPLCAAFLISEMMMSRSFTPKRILSKFCDYVKMAGGGGIDIWIKTESSWKKFSDDDLVPASLLQQLEEQLNSAGDSKNKVVAGPDFRAVPIYFGESRIGALTVRNGKADAFADDDLEGWSKSLAGVLAELSPSSKAA